MSSAGKGLVPRELSLVDLDAHPDALPDADEHIDTSPKSIRVADDARDPRSAPDALAIAPAVTRPGEWGHLVGGKIIAGRYQVEAPIGEGGMGRIFRVRHLRLDKAFALKLMRTRFSEDAKLRASFYREARLASSLAHPNIVSIIDFGEDAELGAFMVMELLDGEPLSARLKKGPLPLKLACETLLDVAGALHYIHHKKIVHCDIKADNILLCQVPDASRPRRQIKLLDFGLARFGSDSTRRAEKVDGTPEYMSPERIRGREPHPSMDIYGLGVLAYELITGQLPFRGEMNEVLHAHVRKMPDWPSAKLGEPLDERAEQLIMRALAKKPQDRQKDMAAFIYELRTLMDMLGFWHKRRITTKVRAVVSATGKHDRAGRMAFELAAIPIAGVNVDGTVVVANHAFARFLTGDGTVSVDGDNVFSSKIVEVHPGFSADLRKVHVDGSSLKRTLRLHTADGQDVHLLLWLTVGRPEAGDVLLTIHSLQET